MSKSLPAKNLPPPCPETRMAEAFGVIVLNPIFAGWTQEEKDLAFVGALAAQVSQQAAQEAVSVLRSLRGDMPDEAIRRGGEAWGRMLTEIDKEVAKLGGGAAADAARGAWAGTEARATDA